MYKKGKHSHIQQALIITGHSHLTYVCHSGILDENLPEWSIRGYSTKIYPIRSYGATRRNPPEWSIRGYSTKIHTIRSCEATRRKSTRIASSGYSTKIHSRRHIRVYSTKIHPNSNSGLLTKNPPELLTIFYPVQ